MLRAISTISFRFKRSSKSSEFVCTHDRGREEERECEKEIEREIERERERVPFSFRYPVRLLLYRLMKRRSTVGLREDQCVCVCVCESVCV